MVVDPVGLTLGLASLFAASLEVLDRISAAKSYGKDYLLFVTKVETERLRLFLWGKAVGLSGTSASSQHLQDPQIRIKVSELLNWAIQLFEDSETFKTRHSKDMVVTSSTPGQGGSLVATGKKASAMMRIKWVLSGKRKSEKLLQDLSWFVDKLHELVPPSGAVVLAGQPVSATNVLRLTGGSHRVESRARRTRKHARRIAVGMDKKLKEIRVDERYVTFRALRMLAPGGCVALEPPCVAQQCYATRLGTRNT